MNPAFSEHSPEWYEMTGALVGLARALEGKEPAPSAIQAIIKGLYLAAPGMAAEPAVLDSTTRLIREEKAKAAPDCASCQSPCQRTADHDMKAMWNRAGTLRSEKFLLFTALCFIGSASFHAEPREVSDEVIHFLCDGLFLLGYAYEPGQLDTVLSKAAGLYFPVS